MSTRRPASGNADHAPKPVTRAVLGDILARLLWESLSDDLADPDVEALFTSIEVPVAHGIPGQRAFEELLIFHLWLQTRTVQSALGGRMDEAGVREVLDRMHHAVFEDMVENGTPRAQLPSFEERAAHRYSEYHREVREPAMGLGAAVVRHLAGTNRPLSEEAARFVDVRASEASRPLHDYLEEVRLAGEE